MNNIYETLSGIVSDLFPKLVEEVIDYGILQEAIKNQCLKHGLEDVPDFVKKVIQLYETTIVRHGLMLVGPTGSGKTQVSLKKFIILIKFTFTSIFTERRRRRHLQRCPVNLANFNKTTNMIPTYTL